MVHITAVHLVGGREHEHIASVRWRNPASGNTGESTTEEMVDWLGKSGSIARVTVGHTHVDVEIYRGKWLRTRADGVWKDNLLALPRY